MQTASADAHFAHCISFVSSMLLACPALPLAFDQQGLLCDVSVVRCGSTAWHTKPPAAAGGSLWRVLSFSGHTMLGLPCVCLPHRGACHPIGTLVHAFVAIGKQHCVAGTLKMSWMSFAVFQCRRH